MIMNAYKTFTRALLVHLDFFQREKINNSIDKKVTEANLNIKHVDSFFPC